MSNQATQTDQDVQALVTAAKAGDYAAFERLVELNEGAIYTLAMRMLQRREDAEEVVQETFLSVLEHLAISEESPPSGPGWSWLGAIRVKWWWTIALAASAGSDSDLLTVKDVGRYTRVAKMSVTPEMFRLPFEPDDAVMVGRGKTARAANVLAVMDDAHLKLDRRISWREGDWVTFPYQGDAPDVGAWEFGDDQRIIGPSWKAYPCRTFAR